MDDHTEPAPPQQDTASSSFQPDHNLAPPLASTSQAAHDARRETPPRTSSLAPAPYEAIYERVPGSPGIGTVPPLRRRSRLLLILGVALLCAIVLAAAGLVFYRYATHDSGQTTVTGGVLTATPSGLYFRNTAENIAFVAPATWSRYPTASAQVMVRGGGCSFGVLEQRTKLSIPAFADAEAKDMKRRHPEAMPIVAPRTVAGKNGLAFTGAYTDSEGGPMSQTYILIDRGPTVITLIETATDPACAQSFANVEDSLHL